MSTENSRLEGEYIKDGHTVRLILVKKKVRKERNHHGGAEGNSLSHQDESNQQHSPTAQPEGIQLAAGGRWTQVERSSTLQSKSQGTLTDYHSIGKRDRSRRPTLQTYDDPSLVTARKSIISHLIDTTTNFGLTTGNRSPDKTGCQDVGTHDDVESSYMSLPDLKTALKNVPHATQDNCDVTYEKNSGLNKKSGGVSCGTVTEYHRLRHKEKPTDPKEVICLSPKGSRVQRSRSTVKYLLALHDELIGTIPEESSRDNVTSESKVNAGDEHQNQSTPDYCVRDNEVQTGDGANCEIRGKRFRAHSLAGPDVTVDAKSQSRDVKDRKGSASRSSQEKASYYYRVSRPSSENSQDAWVSCQVDYLDSDTKYPLFEVTMTDHILDSSIKFGKPKFSSKNGEKLQYIKGYWTNKREHATSTRELPCYDIPATSDGTTMYGVKTLMVGDQSTKTDISWTEQAYPTSKNLFQYESLGPNASGASASRRSAEQIRTALTSPNSAEIITAESVTPAIDQMAEVKNPLAGQSYDTEIAGRQHHLNYQMTAQQQNITDHPVVGDNSDLAQNKPRNIQMTSDVQALMRSGSRPARETSFVIDETHSAAKRPISIPVKSKSVTLQRAHVKSAFPQMKRFTISPERQATSGMMAMNTDSQFILRSSVSPYFDWHKRRQTMPDKQLNIRRTPIGQDLQMLNRISADFKRMQTPRRKSIAVPTEDRLNIPIRRGSLQLSSSKSSDRSYNRYGVPFTLTISTPRTNLIPRLLPARQTRMETRYARKTSEPPATKPDESLTWTANQWLRPYQLSYDSHIECTSPQKAMPVLNIPLVDCEIVHQEHTLSAHNNWISLDFVDMAATDIHQSYRRRSSLAQKTLRRNSLASRNYQGYLRRKEKPMVLYSSKAKFRPRLEFDRPIVMQIPDNGRCVHEGFTEVMRECPWLSRPAVRNSVNDDTKVVLPTETNTILMNDMGLNRKCAQVIDKTKREKTSAKQVYISLMYPSNQGFNFEPTTSRSLNNVTTPVFTSLDPGDMPLVVQSYLLPDRTVQPYNPWQELKQDTTVVDIRGLNSESLVCTPIDATENINWDDEASLKINKGRRVAMRKARVGKSNFPGYLHTIGNQSMIYESAAEPDDWCYADVADVEEDDVSSLSQEEGLNRRFSRKHTIPATRNFRFTPH